MGHQKSSFCREFDLHFDRCNIGSFRFCLSFLNLFMMISEVVNHSEGSLILQCLQEQLGHLLALVVSYNDNSIVVNIKLTLLVSVSPLISVLNLH